MCVQVFNVFLVITLSGSIFKSISQIIDKPTSVASLLAQSLPGVATFFINYIMLNALSGVPMALLRPGPLIVTPILVKFLAKTARERKETLAGSQGSMNWGGIVPATLLVANIAAVYSSINPIILPFAAVYFLLSLVVYKYNMVGSVCVCVCLCVWLCMAVCVWRGDVGVVWCAVLSCGVV
jgi:hypothetical protein